MNWVSDPGVGLAASLALAVIFVWTGASKLSALDEFAGVVANYRLLPLLTFVTPVARAIPVLEIAAGVGVLVPVTRVWAAMLMLVLLVMFTLALTINLVRGRTHIDCGCFRLQARRPISWALVVRNGLMVAVVGLVLLWHSQRALTWLDFVTAIGAALALTLLYVATPMLTSFRFDDDSLDAESLLSAEIDDD